MTERVDPPPPPPPPLPSPSAAEAGLLAPASAPFAASIPPVWQNPWLFVALLALALAGWQWVETRIRLAETQQELAKRLAESDTVAKESRALAKQAQEELATLQSRLGEFDAKLAESRGQQAILENLYQDLARNRDEWALAEIEQSVTLAAQQLQMTGNVPAAIVALQAADARLATNGRPQFISLRKVLGRDLERLRALPQIDLAGMSLRLEGVIAAVDALPLAVDVRPRDEGKVASDAAQAPLSMSSLAFWQHLALAFWGEVRSLVRIQRFDRDEPALLAPGQVFFLRENLKLRLLNARLALLARDQWIFRSELKQARNWLDRYYDEREKTVQTAQLALKQLAGAELNIELPNLNESLSAIRSFRLVKERK
jgi:uroporphyrin-3 C-methyltransferase